MDGFEASADVRTFFKDQVAEALRSLEVKTAESTEHYLVNLLAGYAVSDRIQDAFTPFVELLSRAYEATGEQRVRKLRDVGDAALFVSGFFADSCDRRGVTTTYVAAIGSRAYGEIGRASRWAPPSAAAHSHVFEELAGRFEAFVRVLDEVREHTAFCTDGDTLQLYERWHATRSPALFRKLRRRGVAPDPMGGSGGTGGPGGGRGSGEIN